MQCQGLHCSPIKNQLRVETRLNQPLIDTQLLQIVHLELIIFFSLLLICYTFKCQVIK